VNVALDSDVFIADRWFERLPHVLVGATEILAAGTSETASSTK
jgi:hypothetical protein